MGYFLAYIAKYLPKLGNIVKFCCVAPVIDACLWVYGSYPPSNAYYFNFFTFFSFLYLKKTKNSVKSSKLVGNRQTTHICAKELMEVFFDTLSALQPPKIVNISPIEKLVRSGNVIYWMKWLVVFSGKSLIKNSFEVGQSGRNR